MRLTGLFIRRRGAVLSLLLLILVAQPILAASFSLEFFQTDYNAHVPGLTHSDWGLAALSFTSNPSETIPSQYLNLIINGVWQIQNMPIMGHDPNALARTFGAVFDLGSPGVPVTSLNYFADLSLNPLTEFAPSGAPDSADVSPFSAQVGGISGSPFVPGDDPAPYRRAGGPPEVQPPDQKLERADMVNQEVGKNECAPGAFSNSLIWLDKKNEKLTIPDKPKSIAGQKEILGWTADGVSPGSWKKKAEALKDYVTTKYFGPGEMDKIYQEFQHGEDIELWGQGHAAVVSCVIKHGDGTYSICIDHDTKQGVDGKEGVNGGLMTQVLKMDKDGKFTNSAYGIKAGESARGFVSESPVPEPSQYLLLCVLFSGLVWRARWVGRA